MDRNFLIAIVLSLGVLLGWELLVVAPQQKAQMAERQRAAAAEKLKLPDAADLGTAAPAATAPSIETALATGSGRVPIDTPSLDGSINLLGARIDDLKLKSYHETLDDKSPEIRLLSPRETEHGHYVQLGWIASDFAGEEAAWTAPAGAKLTPQSPVTLTRREGDLVLEQKISIDDRFMFTVEQSVRNEGAAAATATAYALVIQRGLPAEHAKTTIVHEGPIAVIGDGLFERKFQRLVKQGASAKVDAEGEKGWIGITSKYWLAAAVPPQTEHFKAALANVGTKEAPIFRASYSLGARSIEPGKELTLVSHIFGGAKNVDVLQAYEQPVEEGGLGVWDFDKAVDWGNFWMFTRPIFYTLDFFGDNVGNFGVAILLLTLLVKALMFPLANKSYESMSKMKKLQPDVQKLQERYKDDKVKLQQEMMALYQKEKMNPLAGCVPVLIQMPIFFALYKTLFITIEMRHAPFVLWIKDLSAPDPTSIFNLFGLLPYDPTSLPFVGAFLGIGVLPLLMGVAMWFQTKLNPPPADPVQAQVFGLMPIMFTFLFASFAAGLVLYWFWNTLLSILQQWMIMKRNGVTVDWGANFNFGGAKKPEGGK
jgi:YidC/Oxa1 family membrane protein insertase